MLGKLIQIQNRVIGQLTKHFLFLAGNCPVSANISMIFPVESMKMSQQ